MTDQKKDREKYLQKFREDVEWLKENIPEEDIYEFAEQALCAADFFIMKWREWVDIEEEAEKDKVIGKWLQNVVGLRILKDLNINGALKKRIVGPEED